MPDPITNGESGLSVRNKINTLFSDLVYEEGNWTPTLGTIHSGNYSAITGITVHYAKYERIGNLCNIWLAFTPTGLTTAAFTQKSTMHLRGLPFDVANLSGSVDLSVGGGTVYQSLSGSLVSKLEAVASFSDNLYLFLFYTGSGEARRTDTHYVHASYLIA